MVVLFTAMLFIALVAGIVACFTFLSLIPAIIAAIIGTPSLLWCGITAYGLIRRAQPLRPFDAEEQAESAARVGGKGRYITTADGRIVEYLVYGSEQPDAKVIVQMHGSTTSGGWQCKMNASLCKELNLKGIAPSVPNHGYSDLYIGRTLAEFPLDLERILEAEGADQFMVEGASFGTAHAMAIAWHFGPERCVAMGLNVPYLSDQICKEFKLESKADALPKPDARTWYQAWNFYVADLMFASPLAPAGRFMTAFPEGKKTIQERPWAINDVAHDQKERLVARGTQGQAWEQFSFDVTVLWGFDPREIKTRNVAVWYAKDDSMVPPSHGEWLANFFGSKEDVKVDIRDENIGLGHFTYFPSQGPEFQASERTMPQVLLDLCARYET